MPYSIKDLKPGDKVEVMASVWLTPGGTISVQDAYMGEGMKEYGWKYLGNQKAEFTIPEDFTPDFPPVTREINRV